MSIDDPNYSGKPLLLYDGECVFCCLWVERWKQECAGVVDFATSQSGAGEAHGFLANQPLIAVQFIQPSGEIFSGAEAVLQLTAIGGGIFGRANLWFYKNSSIARAGAELCYQMIADHRPFFSVLTQLLWGGDVCKPRYETSPKIFLRMLALTFAAAFAGLWWQVDGLIGPQGILPAGEFLGSAHAILGDSAWFAFPTIFWLTGCGSIVLQMVCAVGTFLSLGLLFGHSTRWQGLVFFLLEVLYLSLVNVGQIFMGYQWDALLLEVGFLGVFLAPLPRTSAWPNFFSKVSRWLLVWLLFRLMFASALVKFNSGDPSWHDMGALGFHFWTQPLPNIGGWLAAQLPMEALRLMTFLTLAIEFAAPWLLFGPRNIRLIGAFFIALLQVLIALTGNYGFFNLLSLALCVLVIDDQSWPLRIRSFFNSKITSFPIGTHHHSSNAFEVCLINPIIIIGAAALFLLSLVSFPISWIPKTKVMISCYEKVSPFHIVNGYGLFAVMTKERREIIVEGSDDGEVWKSYPFRFKAGNPLCPPSFVPLLMPRLDWQMWFAALGPANASPWFENFVLRLLQGDSTVLKLLGPQPFSQHPPRYLRARIEDYRFSTPEELRNTGRWWDTKAVGIYLPTVELNTK